LALLFSACSSMFSGWHLRLRWDWFYWLRWDWRGWSSVWGST